MSALCIITTPDEVVIATDGGSFRPDGTLAGIAGKVFLVPEASLVLTGRGPRWAFAELEHALCNSIARLDFDSVLAAAAGYVEYVVGRLDGERLEYDLAGWSEGRQAHEAWAIRGHDTPDAPAFTPFRLPECYIAPPPPEQVARDFGLRLPASGASDWRASPIKYAALCIGALRFCPSIDGGSMGAVYVGSFVQITQITRLAVSSGIVREWPDRVGFRIDPDECLRELSGEALATGVFGPWGKWEIDDAA